MSLKFFKPEDFACRCGRSECEAPLIDMITALKLDGLRLEFGEPMIVDSGSRCQHQNQRVGGEKNSQHLLGKAVDIRCPDGLYLRRLLLLAIKHGFTGIGIKTHMMHLDTRMGLPVVFGYS